METKYCQKLSGLNNITYASRNLFGTIAVGPVTGKCQLKSVACYNSSCPVSYQYKWHFLTTACTICLNQIHPRLKWLYGPVVTRSICQGFILIWLRSLLFLDRCMVLFSFYVEVFVENACVCIRLIGPTYVVVLSIWLFAVFSHCYAVRLITAFVVCE